MLEEFGNFSDAEVQLFMNHIHTRYLNKNEILSKEGDVSTSMFYIVNGSFYQYLHNEAREEEIITDLHIEKDWCLTCKVWSINSLQK